jgi:arylsulfatase A-like enzyme
MAAARPNILFLMTDQLRFDALSCHDGWIRTPNLDRLAAAGADLRGHYAQAPVCVPSRCSLFSGRYPHAHGVMENDLRLPGREPHLLKILRQHGYYLTYSGKNHLLPELELVANVDRCYSQGQPLGPSRARDAYAALERESHEHLLTRDCYGSGRWHDFPDEVTTSGMIAAQTIAHIEGAPTDRPWCAIGSFSDPHVPHVAPRRFAALYPEDELPLPAWQPPPEGCEPRRLRVKRGVQGVAHADEAARRRYLAVYGAMCSYVDELIGRIHGALQPRPDANRTIVVFVSDHGDFCWHRGMVKKDLVLYDDLVHVPALIHWPGGIAPRTVRGTLTEHVDILPTLLELAGLPTPPEIQGRSFAPLLRGQLSDHRDEVHAEVCYPWMRSVHETPEEYRAAWQADQATGGPLADSAPFNVPGDHTRCVRTREWKYIWFVDGFEELFHVASDPAEARNLARDPGHAAVLLDMRRRLADWQAATPTMVDPTSEARHRATYGAWDFTHSVPLEEQPSGRDQN